MTRNGTHVIHAEQAFVYKITPWMARAVCVDGPDDPDLFFHESKTDIAKRLCAVCPVSWDCLSYAKNVEANDGVWGGLTARERHVFLQRHRWRLDPKARADHSERMTQLNRNETKKRKS